MATIEKTQKEQPRPNLGFVVGQYEDILSPGDQAAIKALDQEAANETDPLKRLEAKLDVAIMGADLAIDALVKQQIAEDIAAARTQGGRARGILGTKSTQPEAGEPEPETAPETRGVPKAEELTQYVKLPSLTGDRVIRALKKAGFETDPKKGNGSHQFLRNSETGRTTVVPSGEVNKNTLKAIVVEQAGLTLSQFKDLI